MQRGPAGRESPPRRAAARAADPAMRFRTEARRDAYDAIVVGAGIGGLTAASLLAKSGRSVLVVERHDRPGGYAHSFRRGAVRFDSAVHLVGGCGTGGPAGPGLLHRLLRALGVARACEFVPAAPFYATHFPGLSLDVPTGVEEFVEAHADRFPGVEKSLRSFIQICLDVWREAEDATDVHLSTDLARLRRRHGTLVRFHRATLADVLRAQVEHPGLAAALATLWPYVGLPPSRASFVFFATMLISYLVEGAWYCRGTFQQLAQALATGLDGHGGELLLRSIVQRIRVQDGRACGVRLENGQEISAPLVVSNADARQTFEELLEGEVVEPRFATRIRRMRPSTSAFVVYAAGRFDPRVAGLAHENFFWPGLDHEQHARAAARAAPDWMTLTVPTLLDPGLAPRGTHAFVLTTLVPADAVASWRASKERMTERLLAGAERFLPGFGASLHFVEAGSPRTFERYTRNDSGAIYGWELSPEQVGIGRLSLRSPVEGLFLAGHWTRPGGGIYGVVRSGIESASAVTGLDADTLLTPRPSPPRCDS